MNIGIMTLSASDNCGSLLQAYALKLALEKYGNVEVINFSSIESHAMYDVPRYKGLKKFLFRKKIESLLKSSQDYKDFRKRYIGITGKEYFINDLNDLSDRYDVVVVGSDQVWNVQMSDFSEAFFLSWSNSKKIAYAPSLGGAHLNRSNNYACIKEWLNDFSFLSAREEIGRNCLEEVIRRNVSKVLDPTLIIDEKQWNQLVGEPLIKGDYIFYYSWAYCEKSTSKIVSKESKRSKLPVYVIDPRKWISRNPSKWGFNLYEKSGPLVFLNLIKYANRVYVESFHGMVFSYIFKKNYWLLDTHEKISELDSRLMEFVSLLNARNRILTKYNANKINQEEKVVYGNNELLDELKIKSLGYLEESFRGVEK